ncbi:MAG: SOS response-associated peptidase [Verrucomicrobiota bacterium]|jgi:putative SOS response-associated peptidase YedK
MCARFTLSKELSELGKLIDFVCRVAFFAPRYNIAPRQQAPVIVRENYLTVAKLMRWGLIPSWATEESIGDKLINARAETLTEKSSFRKLFASQRCLIPADGYYEWRRDGQASSVEGRESELGFDTSSGLRQSPHPVPSRRDQPLPSDGRGASDRTPFRFTMKDGGLFCFAGLWDKWIRRPQVQEILIDDEGDVPQPSRVIETFTIITTAPNEMAAAIHDRMPVILAPEHYGWWLYEDGKEEALQSLLSPYPAEDMKCYRVSRLVNNARNDSPDCIKPA